MGMFEILILRVHGKKHWIIQSSMRIVIAGSKPAPATKQNNMEKEFVPYEQALAIKELGFNEPCFGYYQGGTNNLILEQIINSQGNGNWCLAPTCSQAFRFFREKHGLYHIIHCPTEDAATFTITGFGKDTHFSATELRSYSEAERACVDMLIGLVKAQAVLKK